MPRARPRDLANEALRYGTVYAYLPVLLATNSQRFHFVLPDLHSLGQGSKFKAACLSRREIIRL
jgi:hypothetical protein